MVAGVEKLAADWTYDVVSIGYPGPVLAGRPIGAPRNLGAGWVGFDFARSFRRPVKVVNDAAMQALGSYKGGKLLFLGLGTGLGTAMIVEGIVAPMELSHLPYKRRTYEHYVGRVGLDDQLEVASTYFDRELESRIKKFTTMFEPVMIIFVGAIVGFVALALVSAMYGVLNNMKEAG